LTLSLTEMGKSCAIAILEEQQQQISQVLTVLTPKQQQLSTLLTKITSQQPSIGEQAEFMCWLCDLSIYPLEIYQDRWIKLNNIK
jgi:hypothetical protein